MAPATMKWWDDVVSSDLAHYYDSQANAELAVSKAAVGKTSKKGRKGSLIWGDRVRILKKSRQRKLLRSAHEELTGPRTKCGCG